jgi:hypothetical protein
MGKFLGTVFFGFMLVIAGTSTALALQAGGVEVGDYETGSVVGQPFKELEVDAEFVALEIGNVKVWYPPATFIDFKVRPGRPLLFKVTNSASSEHGFLLTADRAGAAPTVLRAELVLKPGETKYIGIPTSDLMYATEGNVLTYKCHLHPAHIGGKLFMNK